jgi:hypothetical protein
MRITNKIAGIAIASGMLLLGATACGGGDDGGYHPPGRGPVIAGVATCAYVVTPAECSDSGVPSTYWYAMPGVQPAGYNENDTSNFVYQMFLWHLMYHAFYGSPGYYDYHVPVSYRTTYVTRYVTTFDRAYSSQETRAQSRSTYVSGNGKKRVSGDKLDSRKVNPKSNSGGSGSGKKGGCLVKPSSAKVFAQLGGPSSFARPGGGGRGSSGGRSRSGSKSGSGSSRGSGRSGSGGC